jgi:predicted enzyme related to lactoylglutathione lyase
MTHSPLTLIEFPADDVERARQFWSALLGCELETRGPEQGEGWQTNRGEVDMGLHRRGRGPGDRFSLPYFRVADLADTLVQVGALGGDVIHAGERWAVCRDSEGSPFGLTAGAADPAAATDG